MEIQSGVWLDTRLALWLAETRVLVVADLHWGYAASHRARGNLLPLWGDEEIEARLMALVADYSPAEMVWLGDVVHAAEGAGRAEAFMRSAPVPVAHVAGNHDRRWRGAGAKALTRGQFFLHHGDLAQDVPDDRIEIVGHHHPAVDWWDGAGGRVKIPALVANPRRLVLPAFSPWAAGTDLTPLLEADSTVWAISPRRIFAVPMRTKSAV